MHTRVLLVVLLTACSSAPDSTALAPPEPAPPEPASPEPAIEPSAVDTAANEVCARVLVVAWQGASHAPASVTRTREEALARATGLHARVDRIGLDFPSLARSESDAASSGPRGGLLGTYTREEWPAAHQPIRDAIWALPIGATSEVIEAPYGYVIAQRCPVEHIHTRHILVRYQGARNADEDIARSRPQAEARARELLAMAQGGADFETLAREHSEDASSERGGDLGITGRGRLAQAYEDAAYALTVGAITGPVETEFGFHVIQRVPE